MTTQIIADVPAECWPGIMAEVAAAVGHRAATVHAARAELTRHFPTA